jgi:hypothetical protein
VAAVRRVRAEVQRKTDPLRKAGEVGATTEVCVRWDAEDEVARALDLDAEGLLEALGVAEFTRTREGLDGTEVAGLKMAVGKTSLPRCERCRRRRADALVRSGGRDPLCLRCEAWRAQEAATA